jgi:hypothetical protein
LQALDTAKLKLTTASSVELGVELGVELSLAIRTNLDKLDVIVIVQTDYQGQTGPPR